MGSVHESCRGIGRGWLAYLPARWSLLGAQPQRDVGGLHRLPYHSHEIVSQRLQVRLVSQLLREPLKSLRGVVLAAVEAAVDDGLDASPQGVETQASAERYDNRYEEWSQTESAELLKIPSSLK